MVFLLPGGGDRPPRPLPQPRRRRDPGPDRHPRLGASLDDLDLLRLQVAALFSHDAAGRIVAKNKPVHAPAPRLFLGRSTAGNLWRFRDDLPDDLVATLEPMLACEPVSADLAGPSTVQVEPVAALAAHAPITEVYAGPAWRVPAALPSSSRAVLVTPDHADSLRAHYPTLVEHLAAMTPCAAVVEEGVAVSVWFSARNSPDVCEAGLDTIHASRGRGHGPAAVAAWAAAVRSTGRQPLYSTSWDNTASRRVAAQLGMTQYAVVLSVY